MQELKLQKLFNGFESNAEDWEYKATVILKGFEGIGCLSSKSIDKVQLYEVYNHYLHYSVFVSATRQEKQLCLQLPSQLEWI